MTEDATAGTESHRYAYTPTLGIYHALTGRNGDILVNEERLKQAMLSADLGVRDLADGIDDLLGRAWDRELEPFRHAGDGAAVRWLHNVV